MNGELGKTEKIKRRVYKKNIEVNILSKNIINPVWLSITEASKLGGVQTKTIRRAIQDKIVKYKVIGNRYLVDMSSIMIFLHSKTKLKNKLNQFGIGQYVEKWKK